MKKVILSLLVIIIGFLNSCADSNQNSNIQKVSELQPTFNIVKTYEVKTHTNNNHTTVYEYTIDSCIYIGTLEGYSGNFLTHKGGYCKHCQNK